MCPGHADAHRPPFETVGYGNTWTATVESRCRDDCRRLCRWADPRDGDPTAQVYAGDTPCKVIGRVSMDLITVDVTHLDDVPDTLETSWRRSGRGR